MNGRQWYLRGNTNFTGTADADVIDSTWAMKKKPSGVYHA